MPDETVPPPAGDYTASQSKRWPLRPALPPKGPLVFRDDVQNHLGGKPPILAFGINDRVMDRAVDDTKAHILLVAGSRGVTGLIKLEVLEADEIADSGNGW